MEGKFAMVHSRDGEAGRVLPALLFGVALLAVAVWVCVTMAVVPILGWMASQDWMPTSCRIVATETEWNDEKTLAVVTPRYSYQFANRSYTGTRYDFSNHRFDAKKVAALAEEYRAGALTTCYVDPAAPAESVLSQQYSGKYTGGCVIGGIFLLLGLALTWVGLRWRSQGMTVSGHLMSGG